MLYFHSYEPLNLSIWELSSLPQKNVHLNTAHIKLKIVVLESVLLRSSATKLTIIGYFCSSKPPDHLTKNQDYFQISFAKLKVVSPVDNNTRCFELLRLLICLYVSCYRFSIGFCAVVFAIWYTLKNSNRLRKFKKFSPLRRIQYVDF